MQNFKLTIDDDRAELKRGLAYLTVQIDSSGEVEIVIQNKAYEYMIDVVTISKGGYRPEAGFVYVSGWGSCEGVPELLQRQGFVEIISTSNGVALCKLTASLIQRLEDSEFSEGCS